LPRFNRGGYLSQAFGVVLHKPSLPAFVTAMALEKRDGNLYYYRNVRDSEGRPKKVYVGAGEFARIASEQDTIRRTAREGERERHRTEVERFETLAAPLVELDETTDILTRAVLVASGYHQHKGEWRGARNT
jgi:hypothetical protein